MKTVKELKDERVETEDRIEALVKAAEKAELTEEQKEEFESLEESIVKVDKNIKLATAVENRSKELAKRKMDEDRVIPGAPQDEASEVKEMSKLSRKYSFAKAAQNIFARKGEIDGVEKELFEEAQNEAKDAGISLTGNVAIPSKFIQVGRRKLLDVATEGTDAVYTEYGGLIPILNPDPVVAQLGITVLSGLQGNVQWTRHNGDVAFAFETENSDVDATTPTLNNISVSPKRFGGYVDVSNQFLKQAPWAVEGWLRGLLSNRYALTVDTQVLAGDGTSNSCTGILNYSGVTVLSLGSGSANDMTYAALLSMIRDTKIANARNGRAGFITNAAGEFALARTPMQGSGVEGNFIYKMNGNLIGRPFFSSELIPDDLSEGGQTDLCGIIYGARWESAILATWGGVDILFDPYTQALGDKKRFVVNAYMDVEIEQPLEFSVCLDWDATDLPAIT